MNVLNIINEVLVEVMSDNNIWYHGSEDARGLMQHGFTQRTDTTNYISDPKRWRELQNEMQIARTTGKEDQYFELLDQAGALRKHMSYKKPIYFSDNRGVANTYSKEKRAFDYQNSEPALLRAQINDNGNILKVSAQGESFRGIKTGIVRNALIKADVSEDEIEKYFDMFPTDIRKGKMTAETLGIIAQLLGFDIVDVQGVLDSYQGGSTKSNVRMVFDPQRIKIISEVKESINEETVNQFKLSNDEERTTITAYNINKKIGSVISEILFNSYQYDFDDVFSEEEFDEIYPKDVIVNIEHIEIDDDFKNQGIGTELMGLMMDTMKKRGYTQYYLNASPMGFAGLKLNDLVEFYKKFGFKELKHQGHNVLMGVNF